MDSNTDKHALNHHHHDVDSSNSCQATKGLSKTGLALRVDLADRTHLGLGAGRPADTRALKKRRDVAGSGPVLIGGPCTKTLPLHRDAFKRTGFLSSE
jgi:hypothetical protein